MWLLLYTYIYIYFYIDGNTADDYASGNNTAFMSPMGNVYNLLHCGVLCIPTA